MKDKIMQVLVWARYKKLDGTWNKTELICDAKVMSGAAIFIFSVFYIWTNLI